jgi:hypothetical protein
VGERRPASAGGMGEAGSALEKVEVWRLEAPVRDEPGIDQHQRRALRTDLSDIGRDTLKSAAPPSGNALRSLEAPFESLRAVTESGAVRNPY